MLQVSEDKEIDTTAIIACPALSFKLRRVTACLKCKEYRGLGVMCTDKSKAWNERYAVRCAHIMERRTQILPEVHE